MALFGQFGSNFDGTTPGNKQDRDNNNNFKYGNNHDHGFGQDSAIQKPATAIKFQARDNSAASAINENEADSRLQDLYSATQRANKEAAADTPFQGKACGTNGTAH